MGMRAEGMYGRWKAQRQAIFHDEEGPLIFPPHGPSMSSCIPFKPHCTPLQSPTSSLTRQLPRSFAPWLSPPRALGGSVSARIIWWTEAEVDFFGEKWMEEAFELRLSVIYDFQQIRCSLELLSHLGRAKGGNCCCRFSSMPADESVLELSAKREGGQWTYFKDRYL